MSDVVEKDGDEFVETLTGPVKPVVATAPLEPKTIIAPAPGSAPVVPPAAVTKRVYRFVKNMSPGQPVEINGKKIQFVRPRLQNGRMSSGGKFQTDDAELAEALREAAKQNPSLYIFEVK